MLFYMPMPYRDLEPFSKRLTIVIGLTVVGFMAFGLLLSFYRNILFEEHLKQLALRNEELDRRIDRGRSDLDYYRSAQYKDKYAKETLGKLSPGEKILIITDQPASPDFTPSSALTPSEQQSAAREELLRQTPVYLHWKLFLFEREKLEEWR